jgi:colanic acid/amylovoran biosynthesis protein
MKILFINAYSAKNRGDYAIILSMSDYLKEIYPNCEIEIMSSYHKENTIIYNANGLISVNSIWNISKGNFLTKYAKGLYMYIKSLINPNNIIFKKIQNSDLICSVGGGYLYSSSKGPLGIGLLNMLFHIWISKKMGKKVICFPQSVGPIHFKLDEIITKKVLQKVDMFISREPITTKYLKNTLQLKNTFEFLDIAFLLKGTSPYKIDISSSKLNIGITVLNWLFADSTSNRNDIDNYISKIKNSFMSLGKNIKIYIFVQVDVSDNDSDYRLSSILKEELLTVGIESEVIRFPKNLNPKIIISTYGMMNIFIASRMHSAIFALNAHVPTIALSYQPKTKGTFEKLNLKEFALDIKEFTEIDLINKINIILKEKYNFNTVNKDILTTIIKEIN